MNLPPIFTQRSPLEGTTDPDDSRVRCRNCRHLQRVAHGGMQCSKTRYRMHQYLLRNCLEFSALPGRRRMTDAIKQIALNARLARACGQRVTITQPVPWVRPPGWPHGELLNVRDNQATYAYDPAKIIEWLESNGLTGTAPRVIGEIVTDD